MTTQTEDPSYADLTAKELLNADGPPTRVADLIEQLSKLPANAPVVLALYGPDAHESSPLDQVELLTYVPSTQYFGTVAAEVDPDDDPDPDEVSAVVLIPSGITPAQDAWFTVGQYAGASVASLRSRAETAETKVGAVERVHVWTNEDGKQFLFAEDVREALGLPR